MDELTLRELRGLVDAWFRTPLWRRWAMTHVIMAKLNYRLPRNGGGDVPA